MGPPRNLATELAKTFRELAELKRNTTEPYEPGWLSRSDECLRRLKFTHREVESFAAIVTGSSVISCPEEMPDDLMAVASSYDSSGRYGTEIPFSDNIGSHFAGGRWQADSKHDAIIAVTNAGAVATQARLKLHYEKGEGKYEVQRTLKPGQQIWLRLAELIRNQIPDRSGNTLPISLSNGTFEVQDLQSLSGSLLVSAISFDNTWGGRVQPRVPECCGINVPAQFFPSFFDIPPNDLWNVFETVANDACTGDQDNLGGDMLSFSTTNSSIAQ